MSYNVLKISFISWITLVALIFCSCEKDEDEQIQLNTHQKTFYSNNQEFLSQFDKTLITDWVSQMEFNQETGVLIDSKALMIEDVMEEDKFNELLLTLYSSNNTRRVIVHDDNKEKELMNPNLSAEKEEGGETHIWKRKKNVEVGGCRFSWFSICAISDDVVVIHD